MKEVKMGLIEFPEVRLAYRHLRRASKFLGSFAIEKGKKEKKNNANTLKKENL